MRNVWRWVIFIIFITLAFTYAKREPLLNAEQIVAQSSFKNRTFNGLTEEIAALDNQVHAYLMQEHSVPVVSVSFGFDKTGTAYEPKIGTALLLADVMINGAGKYSRQELRDVMKEKGIHFWVNAGRDRLNFSFSYVKAFEKESLEIIKTILYQPRIDNEDLELSRQQFSAARKRQQESPQYLLQKLVKNSFYGEHPYARENIPEDKVLAQITREDILTYLKTMMGKDNLKIGIAGDIDAKETKQLLESLFGGLADVAQVTDLPEFKADFSQAKASDMAAFSAQSFVLLVAQGIQRLDEDFYPLYVANYVLGGAGLNSRLNKAVREEKGLTYGIYSGLTNSDAVDLWQMSFSATPSNADKALKIVQQVYDDFYVHGITEAELNTAKKGLMSSFNLRFASLENMADMLEQMQVQNLGKDFLQKRQEMVEKVSLEDVRRAIKKFMPQNLSQMRQFELIGK